MRLNGFMDHVESEGVARQANHNREWTRMDANLGERDRLGGCGVRLAPRFDRKGKPEDVFGETPYRAVETTALPMNPFSGRSRRFAPIGGSAPFLESSKTAYASR
jgi:hypothetical protein